MKFLLVSVCQAVYIIFILNYFKTRYSIAHPMTFFENKLIYHPIGTAEKPISNICKLGHILSWYLAFFIISRAILLTYGCNKKYIKIISLIVLIFGIIMSMMNFNAVLYLLPHFFFETYLINNNYIL